MGRWCCVVEKRLATPRFLTSCPLDESKDSTSAQSQVFHWKQLENLYYRDRKFSIEVHDPRRYEAPLMWCLLCLEPRGQGRLPCG